LWDGESSFFLLQSHLFYKLNMKQHREMGSWRTEPTEPT
jgi:hypothetical protein